MSIRLGSAYTAKRQYLNAVNELEGLLSRFPGNTAALQVLGQAYLGLGNVPQAAAQFEKILKNDPRNIEALTGMAGVSVVQNQPAKAEELYLKAAGIDPKNILAKRGLANLYLRQKAYDKAAALSEEIIKINAPEGRILKGQVLLGQNKPEDAAREFQATVNTNPNSAQARYLLGVALLPGKKTQQAEAQWSEALRIDSGFIPAYGALAQLKLNGGDPNSAIRYAQQGLKINPEANELRMTLGNALMSKKEFDKAVTEFEELSKRLPADAQVSNSLALSYVDLYMSENKPEKAIQVINQRIAKQPGNAGMLELLGQVYFSQKNYAKAEEAYRKALSIDKNNMVAYSLLSRLFMAQNSTEKAVQELKNAIKVNPRSIQAHLLLGYIYESKNDREAAKLQYREALDIDPKSPIAANNLAWILADSGGDLDEALKLAKTAAEKAPDAATIQDTLGWIYYKKGSYKTATEILNDCTRKEPKNAIYRYHLGMSYYKSGERQNAKNALSESIKLSSSFPGMEEAKQILGKL